MAQEQDFSLITVDADEDDDVVIQAGAVRHSDRMDGGASLDGQLAGDSGADAAIAAGADGVAADAAAGVAGAASVASATVADSLVDQAADEASRKEYERHRRQSEARRNATAMLTTEEDLHVKMPFANMQRIIVALLVLLLVAAIVYWFFLR